MPITIYGTDWCDDTRRTRAFLAAKGIRPKFVDIDARPHEARGLSIDGKPISIPIVIFEDGTRLDEPTIDQLEEAFGSQGVSVAIRHRTKLNQALHRFEQYRDDHLVASAEFEDRAGTIVITRLEHHGPRDPSLEEENVERLTSGLVEIVSRSGREVDIDLANDRIPRDNITSTEPTAASADAPASPTPDTSPAPEASPALARPTPESVASDPPAASASAKTTTPPPRRVHIDRSEESEALPVPGTTAEALHFEPDDAVPTCPLTQRFTDLWSSGADHRAATDFAREEGIGRLATIKGLHSLWEMPLTPEAMALAFDESGTSDLAAMFHVLGWIIEQNPTSTMSEFQAFDDATGTSIKTQALSLARRPRDTIALVDRMGPGLHLRTIDERRAREMAALTIRESDGLLKIQDQSTLRHSFGWMFLYQSAEYLDSGDYSKMISGNAPLLVDRFTGALWVTGTEERPDVYAENYTLTGNPLAEPSLQH